MVLMGNKTCLVYTSLPPMSLVLFSNSAVYCSTANSRGRNGVVQLTGLESHCTWAMPSCVTCGPVQLRK